MDFCTLNPSPRSLLASSLRRVWHVLILLALSLGFLHTLHAQTIGVIADGQDIFQGTNLNGNNPRGLITKCTGCHATAANSNTGNNNGTGDRKVGNGVDWGKIFAANQVQADMKKYLPGGTHALTDIDLKNLSAYICSKNTAAIMPPTCYAPVAVTAPNPDLNTIRMSYAGSVGSKSGLQTATLTNLGGAILTGTWKITGSGDFQVNTALDSCPSTSTGYTLAPLSKCSVYVAYAPIATSSSVSVATLTFVTNSTKTAEVSLIGTTAPVPVANLTGTGDYAKVQVNNSNTQSFVLSNQGGAAALLPGKPAITGPDMAEFTLVNRCPTSVAVNQKCTIDVSFKPSRPGLHAATLEVPTNAATGTATMALSGEGSATPVASTSATGGSNVAPSTQTGGGGGCATGNSNNGLLDPTLWLLCALSLVLLVRRRNAGSRH